MNHNPSIYTPQQLACLKQKPIPGHVAIIPDGNRRWAKQRDEMVFVGYQKGARVLIDSVKAGKELGIKTMTFYLFSTENWNRPKAEVAGVMWLLEDFLRRYCQEMLDCGVRLKTLGVLEDLPASVQLAIKETMESTSKCQDIEMVLAINYGGRDEICRAVKKIVEVYDDKKWEKSQITEELISNYLDTSKCKDPELLIRTSGEMRISNFLIWQISYSEIHVTTALWPDFTHEDLLRAIIDFQTRERRLGGT